MKLSELYKSINKEIEIKFGKYGYDTKILVNNKKLNNVKSVTVLAEADKPTKIILEVYNPNLQVIEGYLKG